MDPNTTTNPVPQPITQEPAAPVAPATPLPQSQQQASPAQPLQLTQPNPSVGPLPFVPPVQQPTPPVPSMQPHMAAFMDPANSQPAPTPKRSKLKVVIVLAIILTVLGIGGLGVTALLHKKAPTQNDAVTPQQNTTQDVIKLTDSVKLSAEPVLVVPSSIDGWTPDAKAAADAPGLIHSTGCKMYYSRNVARKTDGVADDKATEATITADIERLKAGGKTTSEITYGTTNVAVTDSSKKLEFKTATFEYADQMFDIIVSARRIDGYLIGMRFYCPRGAFSTDLNQKLLDKLSVTLKESS